MAEKVRKTQEEQVIEMLKREGLSENSKRKRFRQNRIGLSTLCLNASGKMTSRQHASANKAVG